MSITSTTLLSKLSVLFDRIVYCKHGSVRKVFKAEVGMKQVAALSESLKDALAENFVYFAVVRVKMRY